MIEWVKKHWGILAAIAVGIPVLIWLYNYEQQQSATNQANAVQNAQDQSLQNEEAAQAQETALSDLTDGGASTSQPTESTSGTTFTNSPATTTSTSTVNATAPVSVTALPGAETGSLEAGVFSNITGLDAGELAALQTSQTPTFSVPTAPVPSPVATTGTVISTLFGASQIQANEVNQTPRTPAPATTPGRMVPGATLNQTGEIPQHAILDPVRGSIA
jgi:cytoskeletal protein RodZ